MIRYRAFQNSDPPALADIWRSHAAAHGGEHCMSAALWEELVLSKPYFDRQGLVVALDEATPVGFVHAAFGPSDDQSQLSTRVGVTCLLLVRPDRWQSDVPGELLAKSEAYLQGHGANVLYAGGGRTLNPFYLGLYGGSELPGVLDSDVEAQRLYRAHGYVEVERYRLFRRSLDGFRPPVSRQQMQVRRRAVVASHPDPPSANWWEACTFGGFECLRFELLPKEGGPAAAWVTFWNIEPLSVSWGARAAGLIKLEVCEDQRRQGLATCLVGEALKQLEQSGFTQVIAQAGQADSAVLGLYQNLGFEETAQGTVFRKNE